MILKILEQGMEEKIKQDSDNQELDMRRHQSLSAFLYDQILMQYGLKTIAVKTII